MTMRQIGLEAVLKDQQFQQGMSRYMQGLDKMTQSTDRSSNAITAAFSRIENLASGALTVGIGAATAAFGAFAAASAKGLSEAQAWGETLDDLGNQFGLDGIDAAKWAQAFNHVGLSVEEGAAGLNFFTRGLAETFKISDKGVKTLTPFGLALKKIGVTAYDSKGKLKTFDQVLPDIMESFKKMPNGIAKTNLAMQLFGGRGGSKFLEFLSQGKAGLKDAEKLVEEFGLEIENDGVEALDNYGKAWNDINAKIKGIWVQIGLEVLPIFKRFADFISERVLPAVNQFARDALPKLVAMFDAVAARFQLFVAAFQRGGIGGVFGELGKQLGDALKGFDLTTALRGIIPQLQAVWNQISPELAKWGKQFWGWVTNDVVPNVGAQLGKVVTAMQQWLSNEANTRPIWVAIQSWTGKFWEWLTNPTNGAIVTVASKFEELTKAIRAWSESDKAQEQFINVGKQIAQTIIDGIVSLFQENPDGDSVFVALGRSLARAAENVMQTFRNIGSGIARGVIEAILNAFGYDTASAQRTAQSIVGWFNRVADFIIAYGTPAAFALRLFDNFIASWNALFGAWNPGTKTPPSLGGSGGGTIGTSLGGAIGAPQSSVISPPQVVRNSSTSRSVNVTNNIGGDVSGLSPARVAQISQEIANATIGAVLGVA